MSNFDNYYENTVWKGTVRGDNGENSVERDSLEEIVEKDRSEGEQCGKGQLGIVEQNRSEGEIERALVDMESRMGQSGIVEQNRSEGEIERTVWKRTEVRENSVERDSWG
uniref:Uncharacterized protein n=1 Tax=Cacopsylla melanoneura TaxID=428564 RepID=A0A8D8Z4Y8_9HEMI